MLVYRHQRPKKISPRCIMLSLVALVSIVASFVTFLIMRHICIIHSYTESYLESSGAIGNQHFATTATTVTATHEIKDSPLSSNLVSYESLKVQKESERKHQRVVILVGPHKTGSTSIQNNFHEWTGSENYLLKEWSWPVPQLVTHYESQDEYNVGWNPSKGFYALAELLRHEKYSITNRLLFNKKTESEIFEAYQIEFLKAWEAGYSLIIGSEAFDNVIKDDDGEDMIDRLWDLLPKKNSGAQFDPNKVTVVVTYRAPRVKHLISIWRETKKANESFKQWILHTRNKLGATDSLGLAQRFLNKGLKVVIADLHGITQEGYDISNIIACVTLNATCTDDMRVKGSDPPLVMNTKQNFTGNVDVPGNKLDMMDVVMRRYDCNYVEPLFNKYKDSDMLMTICPNALTNLIKTCSSDSKVVKNRGIMKKQLVCITEGKKNCESITK